MIESVRFFRRKVGVIIGRSCFCMWSNLIEGGEIILRGSERFKQLVKQVSSKNVFVTWLYC